MSNTNGTTLFAVIRYVREREREKSILLMQGRSPGNDVRNIDLICCERRMEEGGGRRLLASDVFVQLLEKRKHHLPPSSFQPCRRFIKVNRDLLWLRTFREGESSPGKNGATEFHILTPASHVCVSPSYQTHLIVDLTLLCNCIYSTLELLFPGCEQILQILLVLQILQVLQILLVLQILQVRSEAVWSLFVLLMNDRQQSRVWLKHTEGNFSSRLSWKLQQRQCVLEANSSAGSFLPDEEEEEEEEEELMLVDDGKSL
ncbi:uncharacterized protein V6R79_005363 [Siganus canaliculatus]